MGVIVSGVGEVVDELIGETNSGSWIPIAVDIVDVYVLFEWADARDFGCEDPPGLHDVALQQAEILDHVAGQFDEKAKSIECRDQQRLLGESIV